MTPTGGGDLCRGARPVDGEGNEEEEDYRGEGSKSPVEKEKEEGDFIAGGGRPAKGNGRRMTSRGRRRRRS